MIPGSLNRKNFKRYEGGGAKGCAGGGSVTEFKEFEDRSHAIIMQKEWEVAAGRLDGVDPVVSSAFLTGQNETDSSLP